jgi:eukaryotic-like serine/threonine-protein kinase
VTLERLRASLADHYRLERQLGQGGMATVYLAEDLKHRRKVAIKVLKPELAAVLGGERFLREVETTAGLRHPHILPLYDSGEAEGFLFYVMPLVEGESLRDRLDRERQLPLEDALRITGEVADALDYAHERGIVHRDIKPENIMLEGGHAAVADFGIARAVRAGAGERLTSTGIAVGTPVYMSPEQAAGERDLDGRTDLYSLACTLYEMLAGQPPFTGPTAESVVHQHLTVEPRAITEIRPAVPAGLAAVLQRALAKNPADRFGRVSQFSDALRSSGSEPRGAPPATRQPSRTALRMGLITTAVVAVAAAAWLGGRALMPGVHPATYDRVAVLPLDNATGDSAQAFFADGMTRELIGVLGDAGVRVLGYRAVESYRGTTLPMERIARDLRVNAIVTGAVLKAGDVVQVAAELTDPRSDESLWARTFSRPAPEVVTLQHEVALQIARGIRARLDPDQERALGEARPVIPEAYRQFLLGQEQVSLRRRETIRRGISHLQQSLVLDSTYASAWGTLALAGAMAVFYHAMPPDSARKLTEQASDRALALDPNLGDALIAQGTISWLMDWDFTAADADLRRGMAGTPTLLAQTIYSYFPWAMGRADEALRIGLNVVDLEPTTAQWHNDLAWDRLLAGDTAGARTSALRAIALDSALIEPYQILTQISADGGDVAAARRWAALHGRAGGDSRSQRMLDGYVMARGGDTVGARRQIQILEQEGGFANAGFVLAALGDKDSMYIMFGRAIDARQVNVMYTMNAQPVLRPWRHEPRYQALLARMGMPEEWRR